MKWIFRIMAYGFLWLILMGTIGAGGSYIENLQYEVKYSKPELVSYQYEKVSLDEIPEAQVVYMLKYADDPEEELKTLMQEKEYVKMTYCLSNPSNSAIRLEEGNLFVYESDDSGYVRALRKEMDDTIFDRYDMKSVIPAGKDTFFVEYIEVPKGTESVGFSMLRDSEDDDHTVHTINL